MLRIFGKHDIITYISIWGAYVNHFDWLVKWLSSQQGLRKCYFWSRRLGYYLSNPPGAVERMLRGWYKLFILLLFIFLLISSLYFGRSFPAFKQPASVGLWLFDLLWIQTRSCLCIKGLLRDDNIQTTVFTLNCSDLKSIVRTKKEAQIILKLQDLTFAVLTLNCLTVKLNKLITPNLINYLN